MSDAVDSEDEDDEDEERLLLGERIGGSWVRSSWPSRTKVSSWPERSPVTRMRLSAEKATRQIDLS